MLVRLLLHSYLLSCKSIPSFGQYQTLLLVDTGTCVCVCERLSQSCNMKVKLAGSRSYVSMVTRESITLTHHTLRNRTDVKNNQQHNSSCSHYSTLLHSPNSAFYPWQDGKWKWEYPSKYSDDLRLASKGRYGFFLLWMKCWRCYMQRESDKNKKQKKYTRHRRVHRGRSVPRGICRHSLQVPASEAQHPLSLHHHHTTMQCSTEKHNHQSE